MGDVVKTASELIAPSLPCFEAESSNAIKKGRTHIIGFGFDGTACFRKGTAFGPDHIRELADGIEFYSPYQDRDLSDIQFTDLGNLPCKGEHGQQKGHDAFFKLTENVDLKKDNIKFLALGGEHSISYPFIKKALENYSDLVLLHLDAHADLRDGYEGYHYSHASIIRRCLDHFGKEHQLIQYGIRSGTREEYQWMRENKTLSTSLDDLTKKLNEIDNDRPIYLTLDLDFFDPAFLPGTGTPEAGGEDFHTFIKLIKILNQKNLVGADVVELSPPIDQTGNSTVLACKVVRELLLLLG